VNTSPDLPASPPQRNRLERVKSGMRDPPDSSPEYGDPGQRQHSARALGKRSRPRSRLVGPTAPGRLTTGHSSSSP
jgi:hypothetical protein